MCSHSSAQLAALPASQTSGKHWFATCLPAFSTLQVRLLFFCSGFGVIGVAGCEHAGFKGSVSIRFFGTVGGLCFRILVCLGLGVGSSAFDRILSLSVSISALPSVRPFRPSSTAGTRQIPPLREAAAAEVCHSHCAAGGSMGVEDCCSHLQTRPTIRRLKEFRPETAGASRCPEPSAGYGGCGPRQLAAAESSGSILRRFVSGWNRAGRFAGETF